MARRRPRVQPVGVTGMPCAERRTAAVAEHYVPKPEEGETLTPVPDTLIAPGHLFCLPRVGQLPRDLVQVTTVQGEEIAVKSLLLPNSTRTITIRDLNSPLYRELIVVVPPAAEHRQRVQAGAVYQVWPSGELVEMRDDVWRTWPLGQPCRLPFLPLLVERLPRQPRRQA